MEQFTGLGTALDVRTAKIFLGQGSEYLSCINENAQARDSLKLILGRLAKYELIISKDEYNSINNQAGSSIEESLQNLSNPDTSILKDFKNPDDVYNSMLKFMENMDVSKHRMWAAETRIQYVLAIFTDKVKHINSDSDDVDTLKAKFIFLDSQVNYFKQQIDVLKKAIAVLSK